MFNYQEAKNSGYNDEEILQFLGSQNPDFNMEGALESGYTPNDVIGFLSESKKENPEQLQQKEQESSIPEQAGRVATQFALGAAESALLPWEIGAASLASKDAQTVAYRGNVMEDIETLMDQKSMGIWSEKDQTLLDHLVEQIKNPDKAAEFSQTANVGVRDIAEKVTGLDLQPKNFAEKTANMVGFIKDPTKLSGLTKLGVTPKNVLKAIMPSKTEMLRGVGIEGALEIAEDGGFGPIGKMAAMVVGDLVGSGIAGAGSQGKEFLKNPKEYLANIAASFTSTDKKELQKEIINSFRESGIQADLGTITDNNLVKMTQARLSQSGLVGQELERYKGELFADIKESYKNLATEVGESKFITDYEAGAIAKEEITKIRDADLSEVRKIYQTAEESISKGGIEEPSRVFKTANKLESKLIPGSLKSEGQKKTLEIVKKIKSDVSDASGNIKYANVKDLLNDKIALNEIINYEIQGGTQQLLKELVGDIDKTLISHGKTNPKFATSYLRANKRFKNHAETYRNKDMSKLFREEDPAKIFNKMSSVKEIKNLEKVLGKTKEGKEIFSSLKRKKLEDLFTNSFINNAEKQVKLGVFENALTSPKNAEIAKEILGKSNYAKIQTLQKNAGILNATASKFYNASQSGVVATDVAIASKFLMDTFHLLSGNPWPFVKMSGGFLAARKLSGLMADKNFLKLVEDVILSGKSKNNSKALKAIERMIPIFKQIEEEINEGKQEDEITAI